MVTGLRMLRRTVAWLLMAGALSVTLMGCGSGTSPQAHSAAGTASKSVSVDPGRRHRALSRLHGTVTRITATALTLKTRRGQSVTVHLTSKTKYRAKKAAADRSQIKPGISVIVLVRKGSGSPIARVVRVH